jgi:hypothetical protein
MRLVRSPRGLRGLALGTGSGEEWGLGEPKGVKGVKLEANAPVGVLLFRGVSGAGDLGLATLFSFGVASGVGLSMKQLHHGKSSGMICRSVSFSSATKWVILGGRIKDQIFMGGLNIKYSWELINNIWLILDFNLLQVNFKTPALNCTR